MWRKLTQKFQRPLCADHGSLGSRFQCLLWIKQTLRIDFPVTTKCPWWPQRRGLAVSGCMRYDFLPPFHIQLTLVAGTVPKIQVDQGLIRDT